MSFDGSEEKIKRIAKLSEELKNQNLSLKEQESKIKEIGGNIRNLKHDKWHFEEEIQKLRLLRENPQIPYNVRRKAGEEKAKIGFEGVNEEMLIALEPSKILNVLKKTKVIARESQEARSKENKELEAEIQKTRRLIKPFLNNNEKLIKNKAEEIDKIISKQPVL